MSEKKTIQINPEIFNLNKTKKNKEKKNRPSFVPLISPNVLKNKLLKRIKEHKNKEISNLEKKDSSKEDMDKYSDDLYDSFEYLNSLSKQKKQDDELNKKREELHKRTIKHYSTSSISENVPHVELELPEELLPSSIHMSIDNTIPLELKYNPDNVVPYGCLKGGVKPTYRNFMNKTQKKYEITNPNAALNINAVNSDREKRLNAMRNKIKNKQLEDQLQNIQLIKKTQGYNEMTDNEIKVNSLIPRDDVSELKISIPKEDIPIPNKIDFYSDINNINKIEKLSNQINDTNIDINQNQNNIPIVSAQYPTKRVIKKTIRKKYTLGKSKITKTVAILVKDKNTRKKIMNAQKDLKKKPINDVKQYLRDHNLIKIGSNAPNDVIRKMYESAMLSGEIVNSNQDTLLHNFLKEDNLH